MAAARRFEDLIAWQKARNLTSAIYNATRDSKFARDRGLSEQIQRASVSIMSNIAEGFDRESRAEFRRFLLIAKASCAEVRSQLYVASDIGTIEPGEVSRILEQTVEVSRLIKALRASIPSSKSSPGL